MAVWIVLPTYDEAENIERLIPELLELSCRPRLLVVDDASPDGTGDIAERFARLHPDRVEVLHRPAKQGLGTALLAGFRRALASDAAWILTLDADFSHPLCHISELLARGADADLVIGSRYLGGREISDWAYARRLLSALANGSARLLLGLRATDVTTNFRLYRRSALETLALDRLRSPGYVFLVEILQTIEEAGWNVAEVPVAFRDRRQGRSKITPREVFAGITGIVAVASLRLGRARQSARHRGARPIR